jgi:hypothetical protein
MPRKIYCGFRIASPLVQASDEVSKEMGINRTCLVELALLEFLFNRHNTLSQNLLHNYQKFLKKI